jgi:zinc protease
MKTKKTALLLTLLLFVSFSIQSQNFDSKSKIPTDTSIRIGKLSNGLTYYIKYNGKPEKRVELRLAVNAGSILETDAQRGLAHFTEHMAFNGTKNFEKNELISYLQTIGVRFGADVNAYTSFDQTVYMLQLPTDKEDILKKGFLVLSDWAHNLTFDSVEVEKERGVVIEEWRLGRGGEQRMLDKYLPFLFYKSRYAERIPIGTKENLETFKHFSLIDFYKEWYRPDLMAVIVVGDMPVNEAEEMIKQNFSGIQSPKNEKPREDYGVPDHKETLISINTDKEASSTNVRMFYKADHKPQITLSDFREYYLEQLYSQMLNQRLSELEQQASPPFIGAYSYYSGLVGVRTKDAYVSMAMVSDSGIVSGTKATLEENERVKRYGFTPGELDRAKKDLLNSYEIIYQEKNKTESDKLADEYIRNFLTQEPIPGIAFEYNFFKYLVPQISLDEVNNLAKIWIKDSDRVLVVTAPEKPSIKIPTKDDMLALINNVEKENIKPYEDKLASSELMKEKPVAGKVVDKKYNEKVGVYNLKLSNGVEVLLKPTDFKNDQILMSAVSPGGQFLYPDSDNYSAVYATAVLTEGGVDGFSNIELQKLLSGKAVSVNPIISQYTEGFSGSCAPKDFETMMQLVNLYFTKPRVDTVAYKSYISRFKAYLQNLSSNPQYYYSDQVTRTLTQNHPRGGGIPTPADIDKINLTRAVSIYKDRFADASDFTFVLVGSFKVDSIVPFIETYLGSLPDIHRKESWHDAGIRPPKGPVFKKVYKGADPKSRVTIVFTDSSPYNKKDAYYLESLVDLLNIRLVEDLREEKSGVYNVRASASINRIPYENCNITIRFPCAPENVDSLVNDALEIDKQIEQDGPSKKNLDKVKEAQLREFEVGSKTNEFWLNYLKDKWLYHEDLNDVNNTTKQINKLKAKDIKNVANKYLKKDYIEVVLYPEKKE